MKKHLRTYGSLIVYLTFALGLDRMIAQHNGVMFGDKDFVGFGYVYLLKGIFWPIFATGTLGFLWYQNEKISFDKNYHIFEIILGITGILTTLYFHTHFYFDLPYLFSNGLYGYFGGGITGGLNMALTFIAGVGVMGLVRNKKIEAEGEG